MVICSKTKAHSLKRRIGVCDLFLNPPPFFTGYIFFLFLPNKLTLIIANTSIQYSFYSKWLYIRLNYQEHERFTFEKKYLLFIVRYVRLCNIIINLSDPYYWNSILLSDISNPFQYRNIDMGSISIFKRVSKAWQYLPRLK